MSEVEGRLLSPGGGHNDSPPPEREQLVEVAKRHFALVKGLEKAVADPATGCVDANIVRLLLDRAGRATDA